MRVWRMRTGISITLKPADRRRLKGSRRIATPAQDCGCRALGAPDYPFGFAPVAELVAGAIGDPGERKASCGLDELGPSSVLA